MSNRKLKLWAETPKIGSRYEITLDFDEDDIREENSDSLEPLTDSLILDIAHDYVIDGDALIRVLNWGVEFAD